MREMLSLMTMLLCLAACATASSEKPGIILPAVCRQLSLPDYPRTFQREAADDYDHLPSASPLRLIVRDAKRLRDEVRAMCSEMDTE